MGARYVLVGIIVNRGSGKYGKVAGVNRWPTCEGDWHGKKYEAATRGAAKGGRWLDG